MIPIWIYILTIVIAIIVVAAIICISASGRTSLEEEYRQAIHTLSAEKNAEIEKLKREIEKIQEMRGL